MAADHGKKEDRLAFALSLIRVAFLDEPSWGAGGLVVIPKQYGMVPMWPY